MTQTLLLFSIALLAAALPLIPLLHLFSCSWQVLPDLGSSNHLPILFEAPLTQIWPLALALIVLLFVKRQLSRLNFFPPHDFIIWADVSVPFCSNFTAVSYAIMYAVEWAEQHHHDCNFSSF